MDWLPSTLPYVLPFAVGVLTIVFNSATNRRSDVNVRLTSQRDDFKAVVDPLRDELGAYRNMYGDMKAQVDTLETRLDDVLADKRLLVHDVGRLASHITSHIPDKPIRLHPRVQVLVDKNHLYNDTEGV